MKTALRGCLLLLAGICFAGTGPAWGQSAAGRFVSVTGDVGVVGRDGARRSAERGGEIREGDTIVTAAAALAQARMSDGGLISVRAESEFKLESFAYKGKEDRNASFVVSILKGGFRTITGLIAQVNRGGYKISTPAATIGVRGTHFEVVHVLPQISTQEVPAGTYNRVFEGITTIQNPGGAVLQVVRDQTAFAALQGGAPALIAPPAVIFGRPTPVPRASLPGGDRAHKDDDRALKMEKGGDRAFKMDERAQKGLSRAPGLGTPLETAPTVRTAPLLTPLDSPTTTLQTVPTTTTISPTTTTISPTLSTTTTISPTLSTTTTLSPTTTTTISPTLSTTTTLSPTTTTTISPTLSTTTTISPTTTTTTISPTLSR